MRLLLLAIIFIMASMVFVRGAEANDAEGGPHLIVSPMNGTLEIDRPGEIWFNIENDASISLASGNTSIAGGNLSDNVSGNLSAGISRDKQFPAWLQSAYGIDASEAIGVSAELKPKDARFEMLTGPQFVGSLKNGRGGTALFNLRTDGLTEPGSYPADISVAYRKLSGVLTSGDPDQPDISFRYENVSETVPTEINVVQGPRISVQDVKRSLVAGTESEHNLVFINSGDLPATNLRVKILSDLPFSYSGGSDIIGSLDPGQSATAKFMIKTENHTAAGIYVLQMHIDYLDGNISRTEELAAVVSVDVSSNNTSLLIPGTIALVLAVVACIFFMIYRGQLEMRRKGRWR